MCAPDENTYSTNEIHTMYDILCEEEIIYIEWTERLVDERVNAIRDVFMKLFSNMFFEESSKEAFDDGEKDEPMKSEADKVKGNEYNVTKFKAKTQLMTKNYTRSLRVNLPVKTPYQAVGNINGTWFKKTKDEHPECFGEINLSDPFFQKRRILFTLDLDASEIFDNVINYVTVEVRKKRGSGADFIESVTFDKKRITKEGVSASIEYARMRNEKPGEYEYKAQWSLRGGKLYPRNPRWEKGQWEGVTLAPPVKPLNIDVEADLEELKNNDIAAVTVKLRYRKFGRLYEDPKNMRLSVAGDKPLTSRMIFHDKDNARYDYKVTYHHKQEGPMDMGWISGREDAYIYCFLPEKLQKKEKSELY
jgi:hypothetical protein